MRLTGKALQVTVFVDTDDTWQHRPLYTEIVHRAHAAGRDKDQPGEAAG
jgi:uncharacterized protein